MKVRTTLRKPSTLVRQCRSAKRMLYWRLSTFLPIILAAEFPKSGGTWIAGMVATAAGYRFPRNNLPPHPWKTVLLGHHKSSRVYGNVFAIFRDGRDVMVSAYHHFLFENEWNDPKTVVAVRRDIGYSESDRPYAKFQQFVEWMFTGYCEGISRFSWADFVRSWTDVDVPKVFYERMLENPSAELQKLCHELAISVDDKRIEEIVLEHSFENQTGRMRGTIEDTNAGVFARKGVAGDWRRVFNQATAEVFDHYGGEELVQLGYEPDRGWVSSDRSCDD